LTYAIENLKTRNLVKKDAFFERMNALGLALTYDDVRLKTSYSEAGPSEVDIVSRFSRNTPLKCPISSAAMDTVTESRMAIAMAKVGGIGVIHKALTPDEQTAQVKKVKLHLNGLIENPITVLEVMTIQQIQNMRAEKDYGFSTFPVVNSAGKLTGLLTSNDFDRCENELQFARDAMTPISELTTGQLGINVETAYRIMRDSRKKVLPLISSSGELAGMYVFSDVKRLTCNGSLSHHNVDKNGHLRVAAAIGTGEDELIRAERLIASGCDVIVIDTAHGDSKNVYDTLRVLKSHYNTDVVVGNISEPESAKKLADAGADGIKVGQGPGSICTTRIVAGVGCPQVTAVYECSKIIRGSGIPICADGGIRNSGDIPVAIVAGADCVMLGRMLAGTTEAPGAVRPTPTGLVKVYRGMGSLGAMQASRASRERYRQGDVPKGKLVAEGVETIIPFEGDVEPLLQKYIGGLRAGMGYVGAQTIAELQEKADFRRMSGAGLTESHPHDVTVIDTDNNR
jgi:IMP dehydrogenase